MDLFNYQEIISNENFTHVIEFGSKNGGSALFFADLLSSLNRNGKVLTIDIQATVDKKVIDHPMITVETADSTSQQSEDKIYNFLQDMNHEDLIFAILDSTHTETHVLRELMLINKFLRTDDYLIIEDTWKQYYKGHGPMEAVKKFMSMPLHYYENDIKRETKFGCTVAKYGYWRKTK